MKARLNLSTKPLQTHRSFLAGAGIIGAVAAVIFLILGWHVYSVRKANESQRAKMRNCIRKWLVWNRSGRISKGFSHNPTMHACTSAPHS